MSVWIERGIDCVIGCGFAGRIGEQAAFHGVDDGIGGVDAGQAIVNAFGLFPGIGHQRRAAR